MAHNFYAPGTRLTLRGSGMRRFFGTDRFIVRDTGPALADGHLDAWAPGGCASWGVRTVRLRVGWPRPVKVGRIVKRYPLLHVGPWSR